MEQATLLHLTAAYPPLSAKMACPYAHGPPLNTDIAGIGVRVSFYIQSLCHGVSSLVLYQLRVETTVFQFVSLGRRIPGTL
jgi:hypothetical protein